MFLICSNGCSGTVTLICFSLLSNDVEIFSVLTICVSSFVKYLFKSFEHLESWFVFLFLSCESPLHVPNSSIKFSSATQSCPTLCDPMNCSTPGLPVHHKPPESTQTHAHRVGDAIQPSHPLSSPSSPAPNPSQHQGLFQCINSSHEVAKVLECQLQHQSFQ